MKKGYMDDVHGYTGAFSFWRDSNDRRYWFICGHSQFTKDGRAVMDDFGTLVEVSL
jgi:hypothetical protein